MPIALALVALTTLVVELAMTRVFDVILYPHMAYMVISCAVFCLGLGGIYTTLRPPPAEAAVRERVANVALLYGLTVALIQPLLNRLPFEFGEITDEPSLQAVWFLGMYAAVAIPFFLSGLILATLFSVYARQIQRLYFWDLAGAALGCVVIVPLLPPIGPGGLLLCASTLILVAAALLTSRARKAWTALGAAAVLTAIPIVRMPGYIDFVEHKPDRGAREFRERGLSELIRWDPISKVEVVDIGPVYNILLDGGSQSSFIYPFDRRYAHLRAYLMESIRDQDEGGVLRHFWHRGVLASHFLRRDRNQRVLVIGSAGGQEIKAALAFGASHVDGVEMVGTVIDIGKNRYSAYNGGVLNHPDVEVFRGEGRAFLRSRDDRYDIIQIFSNHSSSSTAAGAGAMDPTYLQTVEAYGEYFDHLAADGILHINHPIYPRMVTTAARAWKQKGRDNFRAHVVVFIRAYVEYESLPTFLVKMSPWTAAEMNDLARFLDGPEDDPYYEVLEHPHDFYSGFLSQAFFSGDELPDALVERMDYRIVPATDDRPYFKFIRKRAGLVSADSKKFTTEGTAIRLNVQLEEGGGIPSDVAHLLVTAFVSLVFAFAFVLVPLLFARVGRRRWSGKLVSLLYFSCLGAGFIIFELVLIQQFMRFIGFPLHTYSTVIFTLLLAAGIGSLTSRRLGIRPQARWQWPFAGILVYGSFLLTTHTVVFDAALGLPTAARILIAALYLFPLGFFLGMPFPLGVLAVEGVSSGAVAWAWGMNGLFTVIGSLASVVLSIYVGFIRTEIVGLALYGLALVAFQRLRQVASPRLAASGRRGPFPA